MEQNFQTSFIPKKPMIPERVVSSRPVSLLTIVAIFIFFTMILATGGLYFYGQIQKKNIAQMENDLTLATQRFEPTKILELQSLDKRLNAANEVLSNHIAISPIFEALQAITLKTISYTNFSYSFGNDNTSSNDTNSNISIKMSGVAEGYTPIALQSDLFATNKNLIDPVFSNLSLDDKGNVTFDLNFSVDRDFVNYEKVLKAASDASTSDTSTTDSQSQTTN
jgi:hypothetical protein